MIYIVEIDFADDDGGGFFGPYTFTNYDESLKFFISAINNEIDEIRLRKNRDCYAAQLYRVDYRKGTVDMLLDYDERGISTK